MELSVVIPILNEVDAVKELHRSICNELQNLTTGFEIIFVDDGSSDGSLETLKQISENDSRVRIISLSRNFGQTSALSAGIRGTSGEYIATLDGDLQNDPADIIPLLDECKKDFDIVSGWRKSREDSLLRVFVSKMANKIASRISGLPLHDYGCSMKVYRKAILQKIHLYGEMHRFLPIYGALKGARVTERVVNHHPRTMGRSKYGYQRILRVLLDMLMFSFLFHSKSPLRYFSPISASVLFGSILSALIGLIYQSIWPLFAACLLFTMAGHLILFALILELIIRTHYLSQKETQYSIQELVNFDFHPDFVRANSRP